LAGRGRGGVGGGGAAPGVRKGADKQKKKTKVISIKNQIRAIERLLKKVTENACPTPLTSILY
jgi:hypothetical protein